MYSANTPTATIEPITTKRMKLSFESIEPQHAATRNALAMKVLT